MRSPSNAIVPVLVLALTATLAGQELHKLSADLDSGEPQRRVAALAALCRSDSPGAADIIELVSAEPAFRRYRVNMIDALRRLRRREGVSIVLAMLAEGAMAKLGSDGLQSDADAACVKIVAAAALAELGGDQALAALRKLFSDKDPPTSLAAARALAISAEGRAHLVAALEAPQPPRHYAAAALAEAGAEETVTVLAIARDWTPDERLALADVLSARGLKPAAGSLEFLEQAMPHASRGSATHFRIREALARLRANSVEPGSHRGRSLLAPDLFGLMPERRMTVWACGPESNALVRPGTVASLSLGTEQVEGLSSADAYLKAIGRRIDSLVPGNWSRLTLPHVEVQAAARRIGLRTAELYMRLEAYLVQRGIAGHTVVWLGWDPEDLAELRYETHAAQSVRMRKGVALASPTEADLSFLSGWVQVWALPEDAAPKDKIQLRAQVGDEIWRMPSSARGSDQEGAARRFLFRTLVNGVSGALLRPEPAVDTEGLEDVLAQADLLAAYLSAIEEAQAMRHDAKADEELLVKLRNAAAGAQDSAGDAGLEALFRSVSERLGALGSNLRLLYADDFEDRSLLDWGSDSAPAYLPSRRRTGLRVDGNFDGNLVLGWERMSDSVRVERENQWNKALRVPRGIVRLKQIGGGRVRDFVLRLRFRRATDIVQWGQVGPRTAMTLIRFRKTARGSATLEFCGGNLRYFCPVRKTISERSAAADAYTVLRKEFVRPKEGVVRDYDAWRGGLPTWFSVTIVACEQYLTVFVDDGGGRKRVLECAFTQTPHGGEFLKGGEIEIETSSEDIYVDDVVLCQIRSEE